MNITIDKAKTLEALKLAEDNFRSNAIKIRDLPSSGRPDEGTLEPVAKIWDARADIVFALITQIESHGKETRNASQGQRDGNDSGQESSSQGASNKE